VASGSGDLTMQRSLNEICGALKKASLGAGFSPGHAEDMAAAGGALIANGMDGVEAVLLTLGSDQHTSDPEVFRAGISGASMVELLICSKHQEPEMTLERVDSPLLIAGFASAYCKHEATSFVVEYDERSKVIVNADGIKLTGNLPRPLQSLILRKIPASDQPVISAQSVAGYSINEKLWPQIQALVQKTYVPASEQSRIKGAGAEINDND
jgi:hypothetical protein